VAVIILTFYPQNNYLSSVGGPPPWWGWFLSYGVGMSAGILRDGARARQHPQWIAAEMALQVGTYIPRVLCVALKGQAGAARKERAGRPAQGQAPDAAPAEPLPSSNAN
jgi:hypothetical protein